MKKILFICHGNICRSPMAEFVMKKMVNREVSDPWYTGDFEAAWRDINIGCNALLKLL